MQGTLSEIDSRSILQLIELGQRTGELFVEAYSLPMVASADAIVSAPPLWRRSKTPIEKSWFVFFLNGQIVYAGDAGSDLSRLRDYLRHYRIALSADHHGPTEAAIATTNAPEYGHLWALLENHTLTAAQGRTILQWMVRETLFDLLSLHQGAFIFEVGPPLAPQLMPMEIGSLIPQIMQQVQAWKQLHPHIQSPEQCPAIAETSHLRAKISESALTAWLDGKTSIRRLARYLHQDILTVANRLYPYVERGDLQMQLSQAAPSTPPLHLLPQNRIPRVVCIDDGVTVRKTVELILNGHGYEGTAISNPLKALSLVFQLKPDLILCDISMPELDGYEICAMLRKSTAFRQTPIIMLTGRDGFIDRVRARMVGATDYLTKPFGEYELLTLIEKYIGPGNPDQPEPEKLLAEALENELEIGIPRSTSATTTQPD